MNVSSEINISATESYNLTNGLDCGGEPHQYGTLERVIIVIIAVCLSLTTVIGNIMVMISFKIDKQLQTISNYFLFSLAVADFAIGLISMPLFTVYTVLGYWPLGPHVCDTWLALDYLASNASVLNLLIISFDRYFSVTLPLSYRAKRTTGRAAIMIGSAWGISMLLWPPWIYAWPYIEGQRTVPDNACYIQFIETNHYITFGTAIAAFYVPATVMSILYWRIWKQTKKRQQALPALQAVQQDDSKRSNSRFEDNDDGDMDHYKRQRSESTTIDISYSDRNCPDYKMQYRPFSWMYLKMWCIAWWHSGRDDDDDDDEVEGAESSRTGHGYDETITPLSAETPLTGTVSRCGSLSDMHVDRSESGDSRKTVKTTDLSTKSISGDCIYTIVISLPQNCGSQSANKYTETPSIKMYYDDAVNFQIHGMMEDTEVDSSKVFTLSSPSSVIRRPSNTHMDMRIPLNAKNIPKTIPGKGVPNKAVDKKKKKAPEKKADRKAAKTLSAILLAFIITWTPYNILVLLKSLTACEWYIPQELWDFFYYLCYINSTVNPMCYALCNAAFRRTYVRILTCKWHSRNRTGVDRG